MTIFTTYSFDSAHWLPDVPEGHKCKNLHGHTYKLRVSVTGPVGSNGWVIDYTDVKAAVQPVVNHLDHTCLNAIKELENPTCENIAVFLWRNIGGLLPEGVLLAELMIQETENSGVIYRGY